MKRWPIFLAALLIWSLLPQQGKELGTLRPASVLRIAAEGKELTIDTDMGDCGKGETLDAALADLEKAAPGTILLDTVNYLLLTKDTQYLIPQLHEVLRPGVRICLSEDVDITKAEAYLNAHMPIYALTNTDAEMQPQTLKQTGDRYVLER